MGERLDVIDELERRLVDSLYGRSRWRYLSSGGSRAWIPAAGLVAVAAAVIAFVVALIPGGGVSPSAALAALDNAARASAHTPSTAIGPGEEWYARIVMTDTLPGLTSSSAASGVPNGGAIASRVVREVWMNRDGATTTRTTVRTTIGGKLEPPERPTTQRTAGHGMVVSPLLPAPLFSYRRLRELPVNTAGLLRVVRGIQATLRARANRAMQTKPVSASTTTTVSHDGRVTFESSAPGVVVGRCCGSTPTQHTTVGELNVIAWLLATPVTSGVRAALYRTAAALPGVRYDGTARDALGRSGVEISIGSRDDQMRMIFDQRTGALLATSSGFGASAEAKGFGRLIETVAVAKVVRTAGHP